MNNNKIIMTIGIILVTFVIVVTGSYALWQLTRSQEDSNVLIGGCLDITMEDATAGITIEKGWPLTDFEGMQLVGYKFTVENKCNTSQDYRIDLDRLVEASGEKAMSNGALATLLDYGVPTLYSELNTIETTETGVKEKRVLAYDTVLASKTNEHVLKLWIDEDASVNEQGSTFLSKVKINAGQGIEKYYTPDECFTVSDSGSITAYNATCGGTDVVIPYKITPVGATNAVAVTQIGNGAFKNKNLTSIELPRTVTTIGNVGFQLNPSLKKIIFKDGLLSIGQNAFGGGTSFTDKGVLSTIVLPNTLKTIGTVAFRFNSLEQVIIPDSVTSLQSGQNFSGNNLKYLKIGKGLEVISGQTFRANYLEYVEIPNNVVEISGGAFANNPIKKLSLGTGLTNIRGLAFANIDPVHEGNYPCGVNYLKEVIIPQNVTTVEENVFGDLSADATLIVQNSSDVATNWGLGWNGNATPQFIPVTTE